MSLWKKMVTALRGGASEVGEAIVDAQALRILDQEIRDADASMLAARNQLIQIKAKHKLSLQRVEEHDKNIANWEQKALAAMNKGEEALALECAEKVAELTALRDQEKLAADQFGVHVAKLTAQVIKAESQIKGLRQQTDMAKARDSVQKRKSTPPRPPVAPMVGLRPQWVRWHASSSVRMSRTQGLKRRMSSPRQPMAVTWSVVSRMRVSAQKQAARRTFSPV